jgi:hypothetical protein
LKHVTVLAVILNLIMIHSTPEKYAAVRARVAKLECPEKRPSFSDLPSLDLFPPGSEELSKISFVKFRNLKKLIPSAETSLRSFEAGFSPTLVRAASVPSALQMGTSSGRSYTKPKNPLLGNMRGRLLQPSLPDLTGQLDLGNNTRVPAAQRPPIRTAALSLKSHTKPGSPPSPEWCRVGRRSLSRDGCFSKRVFNDVIQV